MCVRLDNMRLLVAVTCFLAGCLAQTPQPCTSPPLMDGSLTLITQNEKLSTIVRYLYDAEGQRVRLLAKGSFEKTPFVTDFLLNYREGTLYEICDFSRTCKKKTLKADFLPLGIPKDATLLGEPVLGTSSVTGEGLLATTWTGDMPGPAGKFTSTVTKVSCIPVSTAYQTTQFGWVMINFFNNVVGISDPSQLNPPDFCPQADVDPTEEAVDFLSLFYKKN